MLASTWPFVARVRYQYMHMHTVTRHGLHDIHGQLERIRKIFEK